MQYDVIVVGAGPAGCNAAYHLALGGRKVLVLEKEIFPRYKPCAGAVSVKCLPLLDFDWKRVVEATPEAILFFYHPERWLRVDFEKPLVHMVMRDRFDALLAERAKCAGAEIKFGVLVDNVSVDRNSVTVTTKNGKSYRASYVLGADGANSKIAKKLNLFNNRVFGSSIAIDVEIDDKALKEEKYKKIIKVDCEAIPRGYGWIFPKAGRLSAGLASHKKRLPLNKFADQFLIREGLLNKVVFRKGHLLPADGGKKKPLTSHRAILLGDAGGLVDPLTGEGIYYALKSGALAAEAIIKNNSPEEVACFYRETIYREVLPELSVAGYLAALYYRFTGKMFYLLRLRSNIVASLCEAMCGGGYRQVYKKLFGLFPH